jgi:AraC-like DNA-binding protein
MSADEIIQVIVLSVAFYGAMIGAMLMFVLYRRRESVLGRKMLMLIIVEFGSEMILWLSLLFDIRLPQTAVVAFPVMIFAGLSLEVLSYRVVFEITLRSDVQKFSVIHYFLPILGLGAVIAEIFPNSSISILLFFVAVNLFYSVKYLIRAKRYRRVVVNYSADELRGAIRWVYLMVLIRLAIIPVIIGCILLHGPYLIGCMVILVLLSTFKYAMVVHNIIFENFVIISHDTEDVKPTAYTGFINQEAVRRLELYMRREKPYLNPKLKITDITGDLITNRTSLSALINRNYGMNFCRYINRLRLKELERLKSDPKLQYVDKHELVEMAGFSDWRSYRRIKKNEEIDL